MKVWLSLIAVVLFSGSILQPVLPVYNYFLNYDYIVNVLCVNKDKPEMHCDGKCYLRKELSPSTDLSTKPNILNNYRFKPVPVYFEIMQEFAADFYAKERKDKIPAKDFFYEDLAFEPGIPPPRL